MSGTLKYPKFYTAHCCCKTCGITPKNIYGKGFYTYEAAYNWGKELEDKCVSNGISCVFLKKTNEWVQVYKVGTQLFKITSYPLSYKNI